MAKPKLGKTRHIKRFAFFPKHTTTNTIWLRFYTMIQVWDDKNGWVDMYVLTNY